MRARTALLVALAGLVFLVGCSGESGGTAPSQSETQTAPTMEATTQPKAAIPPTGTVYAPNLDPADFVTSVTNPYFPLKPGDRWVYSAETEEGTEENEVVVLDETRSILGLDALVVHDIVRVDGEVTEDTFDWFAQDRDGTVWYLGEDTKEMANGEVVSTEGSWEAGVDGAQAGVVMQADPAPGPWYWQEFYEGQAEDQAR
ncbi:MAG TPA: hypothetical protein VLA05_08200, partial [Coriobacteriia bacterium]|nr:hypothetical protein [Coriobacteriia bacterium]